jgi:hypothetical protein
VLTIAALLDAVFLAVRRLLYVASMYTFRAAHGVRFSGSRGRSRGAHMAVSSGRHLEVGEAGKV